MPPENERVRPLREWLEGHGIKAVLFDFDDTLVDTQGLQDAQMQRAKAYIMDRLPHIDSKKLDEAVEKADHDAYISHSVSLERYIAMGRYIGEAFPTENPEPFQTAMGNMLASYGMTPQFLPGAKETVMTFREAIPKLGLVTHANKEWTAIKLKSRGLDTVFDHVEIVDEYGAKTAQSWRNAIDRLGVKPEEVLVIGDNITGDIQAARGAGVRYTVLLPSPWKEYASGTAPADTMKAERIADVIPTLLAQNGRVPDTSADKTITLTYEATTITIS